MPFKSKKQETYLRINEPEIYKRWKRRYGLYREAETYKKGTRGPCWKGYTYVGPTKYSKGSCVKNAETMPFIEYGDITIKGQEFDENLGRMVDIYTPVSSPDARKRWVGRTVYDRFRRKGQIVDEGFGKENGEVAYKIWVIKLDDGGFIQVADTINYYLAFPKFDPYGILWQPAEGENWTLLGDSMGSINAYGIDSDRVSFPAFPKDNGPDFSSFNWKRWMAWNPETLEEWARIRNEIERPFSESQYLLRNNKQEYFRRRKMGLYGGRECDVCGNRIEEELMEQMRDTYSDSGDTIYTDIVCPECAVELDEENWEDMWDFFREEGERKWEEEQQEEEHYLLETRPQIVAPLRKSGETMETDYAVAVLAPNDNGVAGTVHFQQTADGVVISYDITGLSDGEHGFHIHEYGDLTEGCESACAHFNPFNTTHGGLDSEVRHEGDLGNIVSKNGRAKGELLAATLSLDYASKTCIVGRMIIVHADRDDLGLGGLNEAGEVVDEKVHQESLKTGNAGKRVGCGVIGLRESPKESSSCSVSKKMEAERKLDESVADWQLRNSKEDVKDMLGSIAYTTAVGGVSLALGFYLAPKLFGKGK